MNTIPFCIFKEPPKNQNVSEYLSNDEVAKYRAVGKLEGFGIPIWPYVPLESIVFSPYIQVQVPSPIHFGIWHDMANIIV
jgi:hypothetical protein